VALCGAAGLEPVRDPTNTDPRFRRNRVRHELLPLLDDIAQRDTAAVIARTAEVLRPDADLLDELAGTVDPTDAGELAAAPVALARRAVRRWLRAVDPEHHPPDAAAVERVLAVARGEATATHVGGGLEVRRSRQRLAVRRLPG
jgi:tRNA(Ile)-lysidine synthase